MADSKKTEIFNSPNSQFFFHENFMDWFIGLVGVSMSCHRSWCYWPRGIPTQILWQINEFYVNSLSLIMIKRKYKESNFLLICISLQIRKKCILLALTFITLTEVILIHESQLKYAFVLELTKTIIVNKKLSMDESILDFSLKRKCRQCELWSA